MTQLLSTTTRVEAPIIIVRIGNVSFGLYHKQKGQVELFGKFYSATQVTYPNYIKSLKVKKINGTLNTYTLTLQYAITAGDDPNMIDKVLSSVAKSRDIVFTYGDATSPNFLYREEKAMITSVRTVPEVANSRITYTIEAVSTALQLNAGTFSFPKRTNTKPSDVLFELLYRRDYGLLDIFYGMADRNTVRQSGVIAANDKPVTIEAQSNISILDYVKYLVSCMSSVNDRSASLQKTAKYTFVVHDEVSEKFPGPYFSVDPVITSSPELTSVDIYNIDIGYPSKDLITQFVVNDNQAYSILYDYANNIKMSDTIYRIDDEGNPMAIYSPKIALNSQLLRTTEREKTWWSQITQFPINASITMKGLLRAVTLMSYLRVNVYYYGKKHNTSGLYIITSEEDNISESGYTTTLSLTRIQGIEYENTNGSNLNLPALKNNILL